VFATVQVVRGTDVAPSGRLRLDALARYLQDAAEDDLADAGWDEPYGWLLPTSTSGSWTAPTASPPPT